MVNSVLVKENEARWYKHMNTNTIRIYWSNEIYKTSIKIVMKALKKQLTYKV